GAAGDGGKQRQRIEPPVDEQRVTAPNRIHQRRCFDRVGKLEQVAGRAKSDQHATVRQRDAELHRPRPSSITAMKSHCTSTSASIGTSMVWRAGRDAGSGNILTHSSLMGLRCNSFTQNVTLTMSSTLAPPASTVRRRFANMNSHCCSTVGGNAWVSGSTPRISPETIMFPIREAFGIGLLCANSSM